MNTDTSDETVEPDGADVVPGVPQPHGGVLKPWPKGTSGNPAGRPRSRIVTLLTEAMDDDAIARALLDEYFRLCQSARSEELRSRMLMDLLDRCGLPRLTPREGSAQASASVITIVRNGSPDLGVGPGPGAVGTPGER